MAREMSAWEKQRNCVKLSQAEAYELMQSKL